MEKPRKIPLGRFLVGVAAYLFAIALICAYGYYSPLKDTELFLFIVLLTYGATSALFYFLSYDRTKTKG